jgi:uncharacterized repeat protein (TIGR03803 family)
MAVLTAVIALLMLAASGFAAGAQFQVLGYLGQTAIDANGPTYGLVVDKVGNLYGQSYGGGTTGGGTVYEFSPQPNGLWADTILWDFCTAPYCYDGVYPSANLIFDSAGNMYGTASYGGTGEYGVVFELTPGPGITWAQKVLYNFQNNGKDGVNPNDTLVLDSSGNLYGTCGTGGKYGYGIVFRLTPRKSGTWNEHILYSFKGNGDGNNPQGGVVLDAAGNVYGMTQNGGSSGFGNVFELENNGGKFTERVIHNFCASGSTICHDGAFPVSPLTIDAAGNLYGTSTIGGSSGLACDTRGCGTVFELSLQANSKWKLTVLHNFQPGYDGIYPSSGLTWDAAGNLYGETSSGGGDNFGTIFELTPGPSGKWKLNTLYYFTGTSDGSAPSGGLAFDSSGNLYGTSVGGAPWQYDPGATIFELTP